MDSSIRELERRAFGGRDLEALADLYVARKRNGQLGAEARGFETVSEGPRVPTRERVLSVRNGRYVEIISRMRSGNVLVWQREDALEAVPSTYTPIFGGFAYKASEDARGEILFTMGGASESVLFGGDA